LNVNPFEISELKQIWIIGSSIISRAEEHTKMRSTGTHLGLDKYGFKLTWVGMPGMSWINIVPIVFRSIRCFEIPRALLLHVGGNDLGNYTTKELIKHLKFAIYVVNCMLPTTSFIFSTILSRRSWRYSSNCIAMENARKRVNRVIRTFFQYNSAYVVTHPDLENCHTSLFKDGVHLSFLGNDIFINIIQGALEHFLLNPYTAN
jgi:hypothetical protein